MVRYIDSRIVDKNHLAEIVSRSLQVTYLEESPELRFGIWLCETSKLMREDLERMSSLRTEMSL